MKSTEAKNNEIEQKSLQVFEQWLLKLFSWCQLVKNDHSFHRQKDFLCYLDLKKKKYSFFFNEETAGLWK